MEDNPAERLPVSTLSFDPKNPRLPEFELTDDSTESEIIQVLWDAMDVRELVLSIGASGFFSHEPLIVDRENGKNVVIEGNRRLAAVRMPTSPSWFAARSFRYGCSLLRRLCRESIGMILRAMRFAVRSVPHRRFLR